MFNDKISTFVWQITKPLNSESPKFKSLSIMLENSRAHEV